MKKIAVVGAGKIGAVIADLLASCADYEVTVIDKSAEQLRQLDAGAPVRTLAVDVADEAGLRSALHGHFAVLSAVPFNVTGKIAEAAAAAGVHYLDLTEDVANTHRVKQLAQRSDPSARVAFIPQCGLAPGFISIVGYELSKHFDTLHDVRLRVGALPEYPSNALNYNLTWSTEGVINEYCEPCEVLVDGEMRRVQPLEEREEFSLDGATYEAFNTSGGIGTLCETLRDRAHNLNYRTIRYPGHAALMKVLLHDLRLSERREVLKDILENSIPATLQDVVIVFVTVTGTQKGKLMQETYANKVYGQVLNGTPRSAIQITTAAGVCAVLDLLATGQLPQRGLVRQEDVPLEAFLNNRFGKVYSTSRAQHAERRIK